MPRTPLPPHRENIPRPNKNSPYPLPPNPTGHPRDTPTQAPGDATNRPQWPLTRSITKRALKSAIKGNSSPTTPVEATKRVDPPQQNALGKPRSPDPDYEQA